MGVRKSFSSMFMWYESACTTTFGRPTSAMKSTVCAVVLSRFDS